MTIDLRDLNIDESLRKTYRSLLQIVHSDFLNDPDSDGEAHRVLDVTTKLMRDAVDMHIDITGKHPGNYLYEAELDTAQRSATK